MRIDEKILDRFNQLIEFEEHEVMKTRMRGGGKDMYNPPYDEVNEEVANQWGISCLHILKTVFGKDSDHYTKFDTAYLKFPDYGPIKRALGILKAAKDDYAGGYLVRLDAAISGEVFQDFIGLAKQSLAEGNKDVAAVLACAALEDTLKRYGTQHNLDVDDKVMQQVVGALKSKGLVTGAQKSLLDTMPKIRDYAMHANWDKITPEDVSSVIGFVEQFLLSHF